MQIKKKKSAIVLFLFLFLFSDVLIAQKTNQAVGLDVIGFGYDVFGTYADMSSKSMYRLFDLGPIREEPIGGSMYEVPEAVMLVNTSKHEITTIEGSSLRSYSRDMAVKAGLSADAMFFSASIDSSFSSHNEGESSTYYYTYRDANIKWTISLLETHSIDKLKARLLPDVKENLNNMDAVTFLRAYGAYYIASAYLGGRAEYNVTVESNSQTSMKEVGVAVKAQYKVISASGSVDSSSSQSSASQFSDSSLIVIGGNSEYANNIRDYGQYEKWADGIKDWPVLCDFEKGSLRPIWELADSAVRRSELKQAFEVLKTEKPLPKEFLDIMAIQTDLYMIQNVETELYWDLPGYNSSAEARAGEAVILYPTDAKAYLPEGIDRFVKVTANKFEPDWVTLQPQHSDKVAALNGEMGFLELAVYNIRDTHNQFKMEPVDDEPEMYFLISRENGKFLTAENGEKGSRMIFTEPVTGKERGQRNQMWYFKKMNPEDVAQPDSGQYTIKSFDSGKFWDFPGTYPGLSSTDLQLWSGKSNMTAADNVIRIAPFDDNKLRLIRPMSHPSALLTAKAESRLNVQNQTRNSSQQWRFVYAGAPRAYYIHSIGVKGQAIDASAKKVNQNGCPVITYPFHGRDNQKWVLYKVQDLDDSLLIYKGQYNIRTATKNLLLEVAGSSPANNKDDANIIAWAPHNSPDGKVKFIPRLDGSFIIQFQNGKRVLDLASGGSKDGQNIQLWKSLKKPQQFWNLNNKKNGIFVITNAKTNKAVDVAGGNGFKKGGNIQQWKVHNGPNQQWKIFHADGSAKGKNIK